MTGNIKDGFGDSIFCLSEEVNDIVLTDAKNEVISKDVDGKKWSPELLSWEKELIQKSKTKKEVHEAQQKIASLRGQREKDNSKVTELQKQIESLKNQISELQKEKAKGDEKINVLQARIEELREQISQTEGEKRDLNEQLQIAKQELEKVKQENSGGQEKIEALKKEVSDLQAKVAGLQRENDELKKQLSGGQIDQTGKVQELEEKIKILEEDIRRKNEVAIALQKNKETTINDLKTEIEKLKKELSQVQPGQNIDQIIEQGKNAKSIEQLEKSIQSLNLYLNSGQIDEQGKKKIEELRDLLAARLKANKDIEEALNDKEIYTLSQEDIVSEFQEHAEKIKDLIDQRAVKDFAERIIDYLGRQKTAHRILSDALRVAAEVSNSDKNQEEGIFEKLRQARQALDNLTEITSPEAKQAYQVMNKGNEVANNIEKLAGQLWNHLKENEKKANDPTNEKFLRELVSRNYTEGTKEYERYWILQKILEEFSQTRLGGIKFHFYPYSTVENADGHTGWKSGKAGKEFNFHLDLNSKYTELDNFSTFAHELAHDLVFVQEYKKLLPKSQSHSKVFWEELYINKDSTLNYLLSCLPPEKQKELKVITNLLLDPKNPDAYVIYSLEHGELEGKARVKKYFGEKEIIDEWNSSRRLILDINNDSMNEDPKNWDPKNREEANKRWVHARALHKTKNLKGTKDDKQAYKIYVFFDEKIAPSNFTEVIKTTFSSENGWQGWNWNHIISSDKTRKLCSRLERIGKSTNCGCGKEEVSTEISQQEAKIVVNQPPVNNNN